MDPKALDLLKKERVCVLAVTLADGAPHSATVHYSELLEPVKLFIQTYPTVKAKAIQERGGRAKASIVVGTSEAEFVTLQMRGDIRIVTDAGELEEIFKIHYAKQPQAEKYKSPSTIILEFTPTWWRYTDFNTSPETVVESK